MKFYKHFEKIVPLKTLEERKSTAHNNGGKLLAINSISVDRLVHLSMATSANEYLIEIEATNAIDADDIAHDIEMDM